jgi:hypothetical protein
MFSHGKQGDGKAMGKQSFHALPHGARAYPRTAGGHPLKIRCQELSLGCARLAGTSKHHTHLVSHEIPTSWPNRPLCI